MNVRRFRLPFLIFLVVGIGLLHFFTPGNMVFYHDTYRRLSYFPIALGAIWFGIRGGVGLAALTSVAFIPHLLIFIGSEPETYLSELTEIILYHAVGLIVGIIAGRESKLRKKYKVLSEKLQNSYQRLHQETELLIETEEQLRLSQKLSTLGQVSTSLAHEIKNPLGSIRGTAEILLDDYPKDHPKREFVDILFAETNRLDTSVNEVLQLFRKPLSEKINEDKEPLTEVIKRVSSLFESDFKNKNIKFSLKGMEHANSILIPGDRIFQILVNLVLNSLDAISRDGNIEIIIVVSSKNVHIEVHDNGVGIPLDIRDKLFEPFFSNKDGGTGLGLFISRKIARGYGGDLTIMDNKSGTALELILPMKS